MADLDLDAFEEIMRQEENRNQGASNNDSQQQLAKQQQHESNGNGNGQVASREGKSSSSRRRSRSQDKDSKIDKHSKHKKHKRSSSKSKKHHHKKHRSHRRHHNSSDSDRSSADGDRSDRKRNQDAHDDDDDASSDDSQDSNNKLKLAAKQAELLKIKEEALQKNIEEAKRQAEESQRDDCTVLVSRINLALDERELYSTFVKAGVGKIRDVRLIRDQRSGRSKGIAYVEFYTPESVLMAMAMSGQQVKGQTIMVQASQAEKNRQAAASKFKKTSENPAGQTGPQQKKELNNRVYVGGLKDALGGSITHGDIQQFFNPFGEIEHIDLPKDPVTQQSKGHAIIEFRKQRDAKDAVSSMNGFEINTKRLKVVILNDQNNKQMTHGTADDDLGEENSSSYLHSAQARTLLMQKLMGDKGGPQSNNVNSTSVASQNFVNPQQQFTQYPNGLQPVNVATGPQAYATKQPTNYLLLCNMFDGKSVDLRKDPAYFIDIKDQVQEVCGDHGKVDKVYVEQNSDGNVWVKFHRDDQVGAQSTVDQLNKQYFDSRLITVHYVPETVFNNKIKER